MTRRTGHPVLLALWVLAGLGVPLAFTSPGFWVLEFLVTPILALATLVATTTPPDIDVALRRGWRPIYFALLGLLAIAGLAGIAATAGEIAGAKFANAPLALLFLLAFVTAWRAIGKPTPRRASVPGALVHVTWVPLLIIDFLFESHAMVAWQDDVAVVAGAAILVASALASVVSLVAFSQTVRVNVPTAVVRD